MEQKILNYYKEHEAEIFEDLKNFTLVEASTSDLDALLEVRKEPVLSRLYMKQQAVMMW